MWIFRLLAVLTASCGALQLPPPWTAARGRGSASAMDPTTAVARGMTRRAAVALPPLLLTALSAPSHAAAAELATAYFSAGDPRFLQPVFDEVKYKGVKRAEVGMLGSTPAIKVTYDAEKVRRTQRRAELRLARPPARASACA